MVVVLALALALVALAGVLLAVRESAARRRRIRDAEPFTGGERAAPEEVLVPNRIVYGQYLGVLLTVAGLAGIVALAR